MKHYTDIPVWRSPTDERLVGTASYDPDQGTVFITLSPDILEWMKALDGPPTSFAFTASGNRVISEEELSERAEELAPHITIINPDDPANEPHEFMRINEGEMKGLCAVCSLGPDSIMHPHLFQPSVADPRMCETCDYPSDVINHVY